MLWGCDGFLTKGKPIAFSSTHPHSNEITTPPPQEAAKLGFRIDFAATPPACAPKEGCGVKVVDYYSLEDVVPFIGAWLLGWSVLLFCVGGRSCRLFTHSFPQKAIIVCSILTLPPTPPPSSQKTTTTTDWNPFFQTWELRGKYPNRGYPRIFNDETVGGEAKKLFDDAQAMLQDIVKHKRLALKGVMGIFPANRVGEDVAVYADDGAREEVVAKFCMLRQQQEKESDEPYFSLADFVAPAGAGVKDYVGAFAVACFGADEEAERFEKQHDDYGKIMAQALADRFVEAFAEALHREMRVKTWGYAPDEELQPEDLLKIKYDGIRPAPGYPSQPDHTEKITMWELLKARELAGIGLTESLSMMPASSVSALVFAHPESQYFAVGRVEKDQVEAYAQRKGMAVEEVERWLAPILNYERE